MGANLLTIGFPRMIMVAIAQNRTNSYGYHVTQAIDIPLFPKFPGLGLRTPDTNYFSKYMRCLRMCLYHDNRFYMICILITINESWP